MNLDKSNDKAILSDDSEHLQSKDNLNDLFHLFWWESEQRFLDFVSEICVRFVIFYKLLFCLWFYVEENVFCYRMRTVIILSLFF